MVRLEHEVLQSVLKPSRYTGGEWNAVRKDWADVDCTFALALPDVYEVGMSNLGLAILYEILNRQDNIAAERVYAPWTDMEQELRERQTPLFSLETRHELSSFDLFGFSLQYEMIYSNVLNMLDLAGIPLWSKDRGEDMPFIVGGGPCVYNVEPVADFFDFFIVGEGEEPILEVSNALIAWKKDGRPGGRRGFLQRLLTMDGIYVPSFYDAEYNEDGTLRSFIPNNICAPASVKKQVVMDVTDTVYPMKPVVPFIKATQDRVVLEIQRGCTRGCRFCQAGMIYRPTRGRNVKRLKEYAKTMLTNTGHEEISLSSLSSSDYSDLKELVMFLIDEFKEKAINISLPSLRIDAFSLDVMSKVQDIRKSSLTFAPEAGSQRMRDVINKGLTEEVILNGAGEAFEGGWTKVKLYFMLGLPTETEEDMKEIAHLAEKVARRYYEIPKDQRHGKCQITASSSFFVPKPFTPFQWAPMCKAEEYMRRAHLVNDEFKEQLNRKSLKYNWHDAEVTVLEGIMARGDRKISKAIEEAYRLGCLFDSWTESFHNELWMQAFENTGVDIDFYNLRERGEDELFPWDFIDIGVTKEFLKQEWNHAMNAEVTPNCRMKCSGCGVAKWKGGVCVESKN